MTSRPGDITARMTQAAGTCPRCRRRELPIYTVGDLSLCGGCFASEVAVGHVVSYSVRERRPADVLA